MTDPDVTIDWSGPLADSDARWGSTFCLYAYSHGASLLYIGKVFESKDGTERSVGVRYSAHMSEGDHADEDTRVGKCVRQSTEHPQVRVGRITLLDGGKVLTEEMVIDLETLLIIYEQPTCNRANKASRGAGRKGLRVNNLGDWSPMLKEQCRVDPGIVKRLADLV